MTGATLDRDRLTKLCGMFGSDHAGERANAAAAADKLIREAGLRWPDVIVPVLSGPAPRHREREIESDDEAIDYALEFQDALTTWEINFLRTLRRQRTPISPKQRTILFDQILDRIMARAA
jgi:hypothetical protein